MANEEFGEVIIFPHSYGGGWCRLAKLDEYQLEVLQTLEKTWGVILMAYEKESTDE